MNYLSIVKKGMVLTAAAVILTGCVNPNSIPGGASAIEINQEEESKFGAFSKVVEGGESFYMFDWGVDGEMTMEEFGKSIEAGGVPEFEEYCFVDLDGENGQELILHTPQGGDCFLILTEIDGKVYGTNKGVRCFEMLQKDGKYIASGGAADNYFYTMKIGKDGVTETLFAEQHGESKEDGTYDAGLVVGEEKVEDFEGWMDENYSDQVDWLAY